MGRRRREKAGPDYKPPEPEADLSKILHKPLRSRLVTERRQNKLRLKAETRRERFAAEARGEHVERTDPRTIEKLAEPDETILPDDDSEVELDEQFDEFESYFKGDTTPKILLTSSDKAVSKQLACFLKEIMYVIPNSFFWPRGRFGLGTICSQAAEHGFTDVVVFQEKLNKIYGVYI